MEEGVFGPFLAPPGLHQPRQVFFVETTGLWSHLYVNDHAEYKRLVEKLEEMVLHALADGSPVIVLPPDCKVVSEVILEEPEVKVEQRGPLIRSRPG